MNFSQKEIVSIRENVKMIQKFMQIPDAMAWYNIKKNNENATGSTGSTAFNYELNEISLQSI